MQYDTARELIIYDNTTRFMVWEYQTNEDKVITDEEKELVELIANHHETLSSSLKNDDLNVFEKYVDCFTEYASMIECQAFEIGFKLG